MNKKGFSLIELTMIIVILATVAGGVYVIVNKPPRQEPAAALPTLAPTALPTFAPLDTNTHDKLINQTSQAVNSLMGELNELDQIEADLELPPVDFSSGL